MLLTTLAVLANPQAQATDYVADVAHSILEFEVDAFLGPVHGTFKEWSVAVSVDGGDLSTLKGSVTVNVATIDTRIGPCFPTASLCRRWRTHTGGCAARRVRVTLSPARSRTAASHRRCCRPTCGWCSSSTATRRAPPRSPFISLNLPKSPFISLCNTASAAEIVI